MYGSHPHGTVHKREVHTRRRPGHIWRTRDNAADNTAATALIAAKRAA